ncbi:MAG: helix-turn-helix transcriptional regulator [Deltaproteobacteria bacterium]|nr:helix-turn-helix transcriptional regulator [Deltaproteobacteria bacterium]
MRKPRNDVTLTFTWPDDMKTIGFVDNQGGAPWRQAFPEFAGNEKGVALAGARGKEGLTQKQLSEKTGIPQRHISEMETGKMQVGRKRAEILADALNVLDYRIFL